MVISSNDARYHSRKKSYYERNRTRILAGIKEYYLANENKLKRNQLKTRYSLTLERFNEMISEQNNQCAICSKDFSETNKPCVDHDHSCCNGKKRSCGKCVRGLLCNSCNKAVGLLKDSVETFKKATEYLKKYSEEHT